MLRKLYSIGFFILLAQNAYAFEVPPNDGFVTQVGTSVISSSEEEILEQRLEEYKSSTSNEIAILIVPTMGQDVIADVAVEVGRDWGVGRNDVNNGVLLLIAIEDRQLFIATGYGVEGALPDILVKGIVDNEITPQFAKGDYVQGINNGVSAIEKALEGEYEPGSGSKSGSDFSVSPIVVVWGLLFFFPFFLAILAALSKTRSWWAGGLLGGFIGFILLVFTSIGVLIACVIAGLLADFIGSMLYQRSKLFRAFVDRIEKKGKGGGWASGWHKGGGSGGGFSGFSGGSFGGGGAGGSW